jgi:hypothetical protein
MDSFTNQVGQTVIVQLRKGPKRLVIEEVDGPSVYVTELLPQGELGYSFTLRDLSLQEKIVRLEGQEGPEANLLRGLLALEARQDGAAARLFSQSEGNLAHALTEYLTGSPAAEIAEDLEPMYEP